MIKVGVHDVTKPRYIITTENKLQSAYNFQGSGQFIPVDVNTRIVTNCCSSVSELGKLLLKASAEGNAEEVRELLGKGSPFLSDWLGTTPLHLAAQSNNLEICEILLNAGILQDSKNKVDRSPLHVAAYEGHLGIVELLIKHGADTNCTDLLNMTPLHWAVQKEHFAVVEFLLKNGSLVNIVNKFNLSPIDIAAQLNRQDIIELLTEFANNTDSDKLLLPQNSIDLTKEDDVELIVPADPFVITNLVADADTVNSNSDKLKNKTSPEVTLSDTENNSEEFSAVKFLQKHGITMIKSDKNETNILNTVMESGHSVVLTEAGKEALKSVKQTEQNTQNKTRKVITLTPEEFLTMMNSNSSKKMSKLKVMSNKPAVKRIVMSRNKLVPVSYGKVISSDQGIKKYTKEEMELVMNELVEARKTIEKYKVKLQKKEEEVEKYKTQLQLLLGQ